MKTKHCVLAFGVVYLICCTALAQDKPGTLASLEFQKVKPQMTPQYEAGRKQKAAWHKQQNDPLPLYVWEIMSGEDTGTYVVGHLGQHWADLDKPAVSDEADLAEFQKLMGSYVESVVARYYDYLPKISNPIEGSSGPEKLSEILEFRVRSGKNAEFRSAIGRVYDATVKTKWRLTISGMCWPAVVRMGLMFSCYRIKPGPTSKTILMSSRFATCLRKLSDRSRLHRSSLRRVDRA